MKRIINPNQQSLINDKGSSGYVDIGTIRIQWGDESLRFVALYGQAAVNRPIVYKSLKEKSLDAVQATSL